MDCVVEEAGDLGSHMMWTIPNMVMREAELSEKDKKDLQFALDHDVSVEICTRVCSTITAAFWTICSLF